MVRRKKKGRVFTLAEDREIQKLSKTGLTKPEIAKKIHRRAQDVTRRIATLSIAPKGKSVTGKKSKLDINRAAFMELLTGEGSNMNGKELYKLSKSKGLGLGRKQQDKLRKDYQLRSRLKNLENVLTNKQSRKEVFSRMKRYYKSGNIGRIRSATDQIATGRGGT